MIRGKSRISNIEVPWRFVLFGLIAIVGGAVGCPLFGWIRGTMVAFDIAAITFVILLVPLLKHGAEEMRGLAASKDANRGLLLLMASVVTGVILVSVASELSQKGRPESIDIGLVIVTLSLCWMFSTLVYALHYAHLFYERDSKGQDNGGLSFPETKEPNYGISHISRPVWR